jgi:hypothetical protein
MDQAPYHLDQIRRDAVLEAIHFMGGTYGLPMREAITCIRWWKQRFHRNQSWAISKLTPAAA